jgi:hypothetical protein
MTCGVFVFARTLSDVSHCSLTTVWVIREALIYAHVGVCLRQQKRHNELHPGQCGSDRA